MKQPETQSQKAIFYDDKRMSLIFTSDKQSHLMLSSLSFDRQELLMHPSPFIAIQGLPVRLLRIGENYICFERHGVIGKVYFKYDTEEDAIHFAMELFSNEAKVISLETPILNFSISEATVYFDPNVGGSLQNRQKEFTAIYPAEASVCAVFSFDPGSYGLGFGYTNLHQKRIILGNGPRPEGGRMSGLFEKLTLNPNKNHTLPEFYLKAGRDWAAFLSPYRKWLNTAFALRQDTPNWVFGTKWLFYTLFDGEGTAVQNWEKEIDAHCSYCQNLGAVPVFWLQNWWKTCERIKGKWYFDHFQGDFTEALPDVYRAIEYIHHKGGKVVVYVNVTAIGEYSDLIHQADYLLVKNEHGGYVRNWGYPMFMLCPDSEEVGTYWDRVMEFLFGKLELDGVFLDQAGGGFSAPYCWNSAHEHKDPDCYGQGMLKLLNGIRNKIRSINPDALIFGELAQDARTQYVDFWLWHWFFGNLNSQDGYGETLVWMKYLRPDAIFVEQESKHYLSDIEACRAAGRGIFINTYIKAEENVGYDFILKYWKEYYQDMHIFHTKAVPVESDCKEISVVLFGSQSSEAILSLMSKGNDFREITVYLPFEDGTHIQLQSWPLKEFLEQRIYYRNKGLPVKFPGIAISYKIKTELSGNY